MVILSEGKKTQSLCHVYYQLFAWDLEKSAKVFPFRHLVHKHISRRNPSVSFITERR